MSEKRLSFPYIMEKNILCCILQGRMGEFNSRKIIEIFQNLEIFYMNTCGNLRHER